jgi:hypothetical protein
MIIWSGLGIIPLFLLAVLAILFGGDQKGPNHQMGMVYALLLTGVLTSTLGWWLRTRPARVVVDKATGREMVLRKRHALFFIPMIYWGPIFLALGVYCWIKH